MSSFEVLEYLSTAKPSELAMVRDTAESLLKASRMTPEEDLEIERALSESAIQFNQGDGIPVKEAWQKLGI